MQNVTEQRNMFVPTSRRGFLKTCGLASLAISAAGVQPCYLYSKDGATPISSDQVRLAVSKAISYLKNKQADNGSWSAGGPDGGATGLVALSLLNAGVDKKDPVILSAMANLAEIPNNSTYSTSLKCQVFTATDPKKYLWQIHIAAKFLISAQKHSGVWSYRKDQSSGGDNSNTQFALMGLHDAALAGVKVPKRVWTNSKNHYVNSQCRDGSWGYSGSPTRGYGSMTAAAIASLYICGQELHVGAKKVFVNGGYPDCGKYSQNKVIARGLEWMASNFSATRNPGNSSWLYYYLYALERAGILSGARNFGKHDWYRAGATVLTKSQRGDGHWGNITDTALALLFLAKGNKPVLVQKVQWNGKWNRNINDLEHLCKYIDKKLGQEISWQTTTLKTDLEELGKSPILFITGHEFPDFTDAETALLGRYIHEAGGTLLFESCCASPGFTRGVRSFVARLLPDRKLHPLPREHPVFHSLHRIDDTYDLEGIGSGCRTEVFFSPRALSCLWELEDIPVESEKAFKLGSNIAALAAAGDQLRDRLETIRLPKKAKPGEKVTQTHRGVLNIGRLIHKGDYNADPLVTLRMAELMKSKAGIDINTKNTHIYATDRKIYNHPIMFMNGHYNFKMTDEEIAALATYLERGGVLLASNCCGTKKFDAGFRAMANALFKGTTLKPLSPKHPIYTGKTGFPLKELHFRPALAKELKKRGTTIPFIEGLEFKKRFVILYSKYDWCCALQGDRPWSCRGYMDDSGVDLAMALIIYAMNL